MATELPDEYDCRQLLPQGAQLTGTIAADRLQRIDAPYRLDGPAQIDLIVRQRADGGVDITGQLSVPLSAQCQRCLDWMAMPLHLPVAVIAVTAAQAVTLVDEDWIALADEKISVGELIEDEILLGCPLAPRHETAACQANPEAALESERKQPFAGLADLLRPGD